MESRFEAMSKEFFGSDQFSRGANTANDISNRVKKGFSDHMGSQLAMYNMPSREDISAIGERIMEVENRLARIENMLMEALPSSPQATRTGPPRTKKPPAKAKAATKSKSKTKTKTTRGSS